MGASLDPWDRRWLAEALGRASSPDNTRVAAQPKGPSIGAQPRFRGERSDGTSRDPYVGASLARLLSDYVPVVGDVKAAAEGGRRAAEGHPISGLAQALAGVVLPAAVTRGKKALGVAEHGVAEALERGAVNPYAHLPEPPRSYHGTSAAFEEFDPKRLDPHALYGPGYYHTENPEIAEGYVGKEVEAIVPEHRRAELAQLLRDETAKEQTMGAYVTREDAESDIARFMRSGDSRDIETVHARNVVDAVADSKINAILNAARPRPAPNVRPARLALSRPYDMDKGVSASDVASVIDAAERVGGQPLPMLRDKHAYVLRGAGDPKAPGLKAATLWDEVAAAFNGDQAKANEVLKAAGYDGITHIGGGNTGNAPHRVHIAFDRAQIRSPWGDWKDAQQFGDSVVVRTGNAMAGRK